MEEIKKTLRRSRIAKVISDNSQKTIKVEIEGKYQHPKYKKYIKRATSFLVHDPEEICKLGDIVRVEECRPISKLKKWVVCEVVKKSSGVVEEIKEAKDDSAGINS